MNRTTSLLLLYLPLLLFTPALSAQSYPHHLKIPYREGARWGYCDTLGQVLHPPQYDAVGFYEYTLPYAIYTQNHRKGLLDSNYTVVFPAQYDDINILSPQQNWSRYGVAGSIQSTANQEPELLLLQMDGKQTLCRHTGETVLPWCDSIVLSHWEEGYILAQEAGKWAVYSKTFEPYTEAVYDRFMFTHPPEAPDTDVDPKALIVLLQRDTTHFLINQHGGMERVSSQNLHRYSPYVFSIYLSGQEDGFHLPISTHKVQENLRQGKYPLQNYRVHDSFIDNSIFGAHYHLLLENEQGFTLFDLETERILPHYYPEILDVVRYSNGRKLLYVKNNGKCGVMDEQGTTVCPLIYDAFLDIRNGFVIVRQGTYEGVFMADSAYGPIPCQYEEIQFFRSLKTSSDRNFWMFIARKSDRCGFVGMNGVEYFK